MFVSKNRGPLVSFQTHPKKGSLRLENGIATQALAEARAAELKEADIVFTTCVSRLDSLLVVWQTERNPKETKHTCR